MTIKRKSALISLERINFIKKCNNTNEESSETSALSGSEKDEYILSDDENSTSCFEVNTNEDISDDDSLSVISNCHVQESISKITLRNCFKAIETASLLLRARNKKITSGLSLLQSHFKANWQHFNYMLQSSYWADKILIDGDKNISVNQLLSEAFYPSKQFMIDITEFNLKNNILGSLVSLNVFTNMDHKEMQHESLPPMSSILVHNAVTDQHGVFINAGSFVKRMSWAPLNPELHCDQYLAISISKEVSDRGDLCDNTDGQMLQIYNCGKLAMSTRQAVTSRLEMVLTHNWGHVYDICWSPQPLPAVVRSQSLIGHLALCCSDGFIRIIPISRQSRPGSLVKLDSNQPVLCLGTTNNRASQPMYPTTMHWAQKFPDRIIAGFNTGHVGLFVLESSVITTRATAHGTNIHLKPSILRRVFRSQCHSVKMSPYSWRLVACSSLLEENTVVIDFDQPPECCVPSPIDMEMNIASRILWPAPGDIMVLATRKYLYSKPGLMMCPVQNPAGRAQKFSISDISTIELCDSLNMVPIGTQTGQLRMSSLNANHINELLRQLTRQSNNLTVNNQLYHQYALKPIVNAEYEDPKPDIKTETRSNTNPCSCPTTLTCIHQLIAKNSIMVVKDANSEPYNWILNSMLCINEIATNPNPGSSTWIAVALECGLVHLVPITHFYRSELDLISTGTCCDALDLAGKSLLNEMMLPPLTSYFSIHGRRRKYPPGVNYAEIYREMGKNYSAKSRQRNSNRNVKSFETVVLNRPPATKATRITDYFSSMVPQSTPKKPNKSDSKSGGIKVTRKASISPVKSQTNQRNIKNLPRERLVSRSSQTEVTGLHSPSRNTSKKKVESSKKKALKRPLKEKNSIKEFIRGKSSQPVQTDNIDSDILIVKVADEQVSHKKNSKTRNDTVSRRLRNSVTQENMENDLNTLSRASNISQHRKSLTRDSKPNKSIKQSENDIDKREQLRPTRRSLATHSSTKNLEKSINFNNHESDSMMRRLRSYDHSRSNAVTESQIDESVMETSELESLLAESPKTHSTPKKTLMKNNDSSTHVSGSILLRLRSNGSSRDSFTDIVSPKLQAQSILNIENNESVNQVCSDSIRSRLRSWGSHEDHASSAALENSIDESVICQLNPVSSGRELSKVCDIGATVPVQLRGYSRGNDNLHLNIEHEIDISSDTRVSQKKLVSLETTDQLKNDSFKTPRTVRSFTSKVHGSKIDVIPNEQSWSECNNAEPHFSEKQEATRNRTDSASTRRVKRRPSEKNGKKGTQKINKTNEYVSNESSMFGVLFSERPKRKRLISCESDEVCTPNSTRHEDGSNISSQRSVPLTPTVANYNVSALDSQLVECYVTLVREDLHEQEPVATQKKSPVDKLSRSQCNDNSYSGQPAGSQSVGVTPRKRLHLSGSKVESWKHFTNSLKKSAMLERWFPEKSSVTRGTPKRRKVSDSNESAEKVTTTNDTCIQKLLPAETKHVFPSRCSRTFKLSIDEGSDSPSFSCDDDIVELPESHYETDLPVVNDHQTSALKKAVFTTPAHVPIKSDSKFNRIRRGHITDIDSGQYDSDTQPSVSTCNFDQLISSQCQSTPRIDREPVNCLMTASPLVQLGVEDRIVVGEKSDLIECRENEIPKKEKRQKRKEKKDKKQKDQSVMGSVKSRKAEKTEAQDKAIKEKSTKKSKADRINSERLERLHNIFALKRQELFESQSMSKSSWIAQNSGPVEDIDVDLNKIDDISLGGNNSFSSPRKKFNSSACVEDRMDKIKQVINRGLSQSTCGGMVAMNDFPELLQPFRPVKPSRISSGPIQPSS